MLSDLLRDTPVASVDQAITCMRPSTIACRPRTASSGSTGSTCTSPLRSVRRSARRLSAIRSSSRHSTSPLRTSTSRRWTARTRAVKGTGGVASVLGARGDRRIRRLQFALAGMNAHINRDLPVGIVEAFHAVGGDPLSDEVRREDFTRVDDHLAQIEAAAKRDLSLGLVELIDEAAGDTDDQLAMWNVKAARAAAWTNAQVLWTLEATPRLRARFFDRLDSLTGFAGRRLLAPTRVLPRPSLG